MHDPRLGEEVNSVLSNVILDRESQRSRGLSPNLPTQVWLPIDQCSFAGGKLGEKIGSGKPGGSRPDNDEVKLSQA